MMLTIIGGLLILVLVQGVCLYVQHKLLHLQRTYIAKLCEMRDTVRRLGWKEMAYRLSQALRAARRRCQGCKETSCDICGIESIVDDTLAKYDAYYSTANEDKSDEA